MASAAHPRAAAAAIGYQTRTSLDHDQTAEIFRELVVPHLADALALARWLVGSRGDAEDIVQDACLRALRAIPNYRGGSARAWVLAIVRNAAFSWLHKQRSSGLVMVGDLADIDDVAIASTDPREAQPTPEAELIRRADSETVERAIAALPVVSREVVVLRDINGLSYKEIAEVMDVPIGTVMSRLARGRQRLAQLLVAEDR